MNLDDLNTLHKLDTQDMFGQIKLLPDQLSDAWEMGQVLPLQEMSTLRRVVIAGMGGSALGGELAAVVAAPHSPVPITVHRDYDLPGWARGPETLVIAISHSGETEETLSAYRQAVENGCHVLAITTGGTLAQLASQQGHPVWLYVHEDEQNQVRPPRTALGYLFGLALAALYRLNLLPDPSADLEETLHAIRNQQTNLLPEVPVMFNPAKRMAGQMMGRWVTVIAADAFAPVAKRWKDQICEMAKAWAQFDTLPEADHTTLAGLNSPESALTQTIALFLAGTANHPRNQLRLEFTREIFMTQAVNTDTITARGESLLAQMWTLLQFGDYTACYLAIAYGEDPSVTEVVSMMKHALGTTNP